MLGHVEEEEEALENTLIGLIKENYNLHIRSSESQHSYIQQIALKLVVLLSKMSTNSSFPLTLPAPMLILIQPNI